MAQLTSAGIQDRHLTTHQDEGTSLVAVVEPQCHGLEHVPFNASLVAMLLSAYPRARVDMYAEATHLTEVRSLLANTRPAESQRVTWKPVTVPARKSSMGNRALGAHRLLLELNQAFRSARPRVLVMATIEAAALALLKVWLETSWRDLAAVAVFHESLSVLDRRRSAHRWQLRFALALPHHRSLKYMVLGENILARLRQIAPKVASHTFAIDHPSLLGDLADGGEPRREEPVTFGFVGGGRGHKGFAEFVALTGKVLRDHPDARFEIIGSAPPDLASSAPPGLVWSATKLPLDDFVRRLRSISYVIWLGTPRHYDLVASGSLVDALALGVPVVCQRGPFVDHLFEKFGDIGIRCDTPAAVGDAICELLENPSNGRRHTADLARAAALLAPESAAENLQGHVGR